MINQTFQNILNSHFGNIGKQLDTISIREQPLAPPENKNADRLAAIQDRMDDLQNELEELERQYDYIASGDEEEDLSAEAMERVDA